MKIVLLENILVACYVSCASFVSGVQSIRQYNPQVLYVTYFQF